ncbi:hypothetical protein [Rothia nasimurium]|uniref:hypothetical protein n=1 Tax=Rothia nasimurium TaxID=85336 RepID=UPI001F3571C3|nr:hypothetical protein [Rothia nasimurium]
MAKNKPTKITRKAPKRYEFVEFESELFDGVFRLPRFTQVDIKTMKEVNSDPSAILRFLENAGVTEDAIEAVSTLDGDEMENFMRDWNDGVVIHPKSLD